MKTNEDYQVLQGDCGFETIENIPSDAVLKKDRVLLIGSNGGNTHYVSADSRGYKIYEKENTTYLEIKNDIKINHQQHYNQILKKNKTGKFKVVSPLESDEFSDLIRKQAD